MKILQEVQEGVEGGSIPTLLGVDISSAFDCIQRSKCLRQLKWLGLGSAALQLFDSYFRDRSQQVEIGSKRGRKRKSETGVLQGSGLSPTLFMVYFLR